MKPYKLTALGAPFGCRNVVDRESGLRCGHVAKNADGSWVGRYWDSGYITSFSMRRVAEAVHQSALAERS